MEDLLVSNVANSLLRCILFTCRNNRKEWQQIPLYHIMSAGVDYKSMKAHNEMNLSL